MLQPGDAVNVRALHSDGLAYRWWEDRVESIGGEEIVTFTPAGKVVHGPSGDWVSRFHGRTFYWLNRPYNLSEIYDPAGQLIEVYVHIASPATLDGYVLTFTDHELDVVLKPGQTPEVVDEDEFTEAARRFGYTTEFQSSCYRAIREVLGFIGDWKPRGI